MLPVVDEIALVPPNDGEASTEVAVVVKQKIKKFNRNPVSFYQVIVIGVLVLFVILACVVIETYVNTKGLRNVQPHSSEDEEYHKHLVESVNEQKLKWKAKYNPSASRSEDDGSHGSSVTMNEVDGRPLLEKFRMSADQLLQDTRKHVKHLLSANVTIPSQFDMRLKYPHCWSVHQIYNQAGCGSCWSVAASAVMSDRICMTSNGSRQTQISALDLTSCCSSCGGCQGTHWALSAFTYWKEHGIVSGGSYGTHEGCRPYSIEPNCGSPCSSSKYSKDRTPVCERKCRTSYGKTYGEDIVQSKEAYWLRAFHGSAEFTLVKVTLDGLIQKRYVEVIQKEILLHGPVLACFTLYEDFQHYSSGIYSADDDRSEQLYGHCAKLLGWGEENGEKFWLYSNTWGRDWGENGFFRVAFSEIPEEVVAGML